jgi:formylglycine-generating enzyme required for sulfatase activity
MGVVYAAHDPTLDRKVAVKVMHPGQDAARFVLESKVTARLPHPGVPPVYALGALEDGRPFLAMKLIQGRTLADELPTTDLPRRLGIFEQICQTVGYAHARGVVHRDLKPSNVMIGAFGEVQVMDWGLAKSVTGGPEEARRPPGSGAPTDVAETAAGALVGTPAYMAPEQARGEQVDARADVFALGGILAVVLTGKPPFLGESAHDTVLMAAQAELDECFAALDASGADEELVALAKRCLAGRPEDRPASGQEVAEAVAAYRAGVEARLHRAERDRAAAEAKAAEAVNTRREAEARAEAERAKADEQRKRRRTQLTLAGMVLVFVVAGSGAAIWVQQKRQADLRAARADTLVQSLATADTVVVPRLIDELKDYRDLTGPKLRELAVQPVGTKPGLHARLALVTDEPERAAELAAYLLACKPDELLTIRAFLAPHAAAVAPTLWAAATDEKADAGMRVRAACALAGLAPDDARWTAVAPAAAEATVGAPPGEFVVWSAALEPVRGVLVPKLLARYPEARERIGGGKLDESALAAEVSRNNLTVDLLARYATDRPVELAELAIIADPRHYKEFAGALNANKEAVIPILKAELAKKPKEGASDAAIDAQAKRQGYSAAALVALGNGESVRAVFAFPKDGDPSARSYLLERLSTIGADPVALVRRFGAEADVSAKRAVLIALGDYPTALVPAGEREPFVSRLLALYRDDPDAGLHSAVDWLLRQKWGKAKELEVIDADLTARARGKIAARAVAVVVAGQPLAGVFGPQLPAPVVTVGKDWFVNGEGQTYSVVGPVEFTMGAPPGEPGAFNQYATAHQKRIGRTFAIATKEVSVEQFRRFQPDYARAADFEPAPDTPAVRITWYAAAEYCNWLSARDGILPDQWCYKPNKDGKYADRMTIKQGHLKLTGYRLPTEAEWEFACRSGSVTARYFGRSEALLPRYAWFLQTANEHTWPIGQLRPNDRGLFDTLGNATEWLENPWSGAYDTNQKEDEDNPQPLLIDGTRKRHQRGGSYYDPAETMRSARRIVALPSEFTRQNGFRPARTLSEEPATPPIKDK